ncbi:hypothetical protein WJ0W_004829 [Paenibacillus melissococcoides]|uniref:Uncharacterized protein n=1 Tax=Paenibacillus melissococcoides TaxID=2912268 RepID=A0ABM9G761_9BACL|nr:MULTISPECIES: hypothetical protein [Paenibacillus]MEB9893025.1 hypothetical protein [Bacillus cereus]CAH8247580.1 hypothetical protein WJ0W_004829 [Paenibacillus melissococcoides]CAH8705403.1 hypothetical protein HTL2_000912 [Paenibacillus melissococcoides]CAH8714820.1 hypothetical protein WDD9_004032 [Paenibacillus melissococcoides]GIO79677.1 hypothetical protein J6TS7_32870 [Paenibacillus dendritiformis]
MASVDVLYGWVREEIKQREEEGCPVDGFRSKLEAAAGDEGKLMALYA